MQPKRPKTRANQFAEPAELSPALSADLWVRPNFHFRRDSRRLRELNITPASGQRFLELADIALGLKKPLLAKKKPKSVAPAIQRQKRKSAPYSN